MAAITYLGEAGLKTLIAKCKTLAWEIEVVSSLPTTGEERILYLLKDTSASGTNLFDEYIWVDGAWEMLGTATLDIDLSNYATKDELSSTESALQTAITQQKDDLESEINDLAGRTVTNVTASGSNELSLSASLVDNGNGKTAEIIGTINLSAYVQSADLTEITASEVETMWDEA